MKVFYKIVSIICLVILLSSCGGQEVIQNQLNWSLEDFEYTNQFGEPFGKKDLQGKVWIANFIFTNCNTVCPPITANMARLQRLIDKEGLDNVALVSYSVDPEVDTPEILQKFASKFTENQKNWYFLTGYVQEHIEQFAKENFRFFIQKIEGQDQVSHGTDLFLIDQSGTIVKSYDAIDVPYEEILNDIIILLKTNK